MSNKCILCGGENITRMNAAFSPFLIERLLDNRNEQSDFIYCADCNFYFCEYRPTPEEMSNLYTNYRSEEYQKQRQKHEPSYTPEVNYSLGQLDETVQLRKNQLSWVLNTFIDISEIKNVLDYGGDNGQFIPDCLDNSNKFVYEISGVETVNGVKSITSKEELTLHQWDLIMCCHVLEHVSFPLDVINEISSIMPKGCYLYIEVPYEDYIERYNDAMTVLIQEHINIFRPKTFQKIFENNGFLILTNRVVEQSSSQTKSKNISCLIQKIK